jgi:hypothetical protein
MLTNANLSYSYSRKGDFHSMTQSLHRNTLKRHSFAIPFICLVLTACSGGSGGTGDPVVGLSMVDFVAASSIDAGVITAEWMPVTDSSTSHADMVYTIHVSTQDGFIPDDSTALKTVTGEVSTNVEGLQPATVYYVIVSATNKKGETSWSNQLQVTSVSVSLQTTAAVVHVQNTAQAVVADTTSISYQLDAGATAPEVGSYLASDEGDGYLRRVTAVSVIGDEVVAETAAASLNELYDSIEISTTVRLGATDTSATQGVVSGISVTQQANQKQAIQWPSGLTLVDENIGQRQVAPVGVLSGVGLTVADNIQTREGEVSRFKADSYLAVAPGTTLLFNVGAEVFDTAANVEICDIRMVKFEHKDSTKNSLARPLPGDLLLTSNNQNGSVTVAWQPTTAHVDTGGLPYKATFTAYVDKVGDGCNGDNLLGVWEDELDLTIPIYVTAGEASVTNEEKSVTFSGDFTVKDDVNFTFEPEFLINAKIEHAVLQTASLKAKANVGAANTLTITATGAGTIDHTQVLLQPRKFTRVFMAGAVPVVVRGEFAINARIEGSVTGVANLVNEVAIEFPDTLFGLEYDKNNGGWQAVNNFDPVYRFEVKGDADASADLTLTLIPDLQIHFYDAASGRMLVEPYLFAETGLHGQFLYQDTSGAKLTDLDYWFTHMNAGAGVNLRMYAGLHIFDYNIASYPADVTIDQTGSFALFTPIDRTVLWGLPTLNSSQDAMQTLTTDSRSILISGSTTDIPFPFGDGASLNPFQKWTAPTVITSSAGAAITPVGTGESGEYWFTYTNPGDYTVRLAGHSKVGWFVRQVTEQSITITDNDSDGLPDQWESRYGITDPTADEDGDGLTNLQEFQSGHFPKLADNGPPVLAIANVTQAEGDSGSSNLSFTVTLNHNATDDVTVGYATANGTATAGSDYTATSGTLTIASGTSSGTINVPVIGDTSVEGNETFTLTLSNPTNATLGTASQATGTILNDDAALPDATIANASIIEGNSGTSNLAFTVTLSSTAPGPVDVNYATSDGTATAGSDYTATSGTLTIASGTSSGTISVPVIGDTVVEGDESFTLTLSNPANATLGTPATATGTITNDDSSSVATRPLNDTGITTCSDDVTNGLTCPQVLFPGQDAEHGRDVTANDDTDGHAGFSFTKLDSGGNPLPATATSWSCVQDNVTGLIWEVKTTSGLQSSGYTYTWYNSTNINDGGDHGVGDTGVGTTTGYETVTGTYAGSDNCADNTRCDTEKYVADVNSGGLCGAADWRLPSSEELSSLVDNSVASPGPTIDMGWFPNTVASLYWSASPDASNSYGAWDVGFNAGVVDFSNKHYARYVRLVRGGQ